MTRRIPSCALILGLLAICGASKAADWIKPVQVPIELAHAVEAPHGALRSEPIAAGNAGVPLVVELAAFGQPERLGFVTPPLPRDLLLLDPFQEAVVQVSDLKTYPAKTVGNMISAQDRWVFPLALQVKNPPSAPSFELVSSLTVSANGPTWKVDSFGSPNLIRAAYGAMLIARELKRPGTTELLLLRGARQQYTLVSVTGLNQFFLGALAEASPTVPTTPGTTVTYLIPIFDSARLGFAKGIPVLASVVFTKLKPAALLHNGLPT